MWSYGGRHASRRPDGNPVTGEGYDEPAQSASWRRRRVTPDTDILLPASAPASSEHASRAPLHLAPPHVAPLPLRLGAGAAGAAPRGRRAAPLLEQPAAGSQSVPGGELRRDSRGLTVPLDALIDSQQRLPRPGSPLAPSAALLLADTGSLGGEAGTSPQDPDPSRILGRASAAALAPPEVQRRGGLGLGDVADHAAGDEAGGQRLSVEASALRGAGEEDSLLQASLAAPERTPPPPGPGPPPRKVPEDLPAAGVSSADAHQQLTHNWFTSRKTRRVPPGGYSKGLW